MQRPINAAFLLLAVGLVALQLTLYVRSQKARQAGTLAAAAEASRPIGE